MKKLFIILPALVALGVIALVVVISQANSPANQQKTGQTEQDESATLQQNSPDSTTQINETDESGYYVEYSDEAVANASGDIYLFFHAPWCPQCRSIEQGIISDGVPGGVTILKVDYDSSQELRKRYGVTLQTTFVNVSDTGDFISMFVAYQDPTFSNVVRNYIKKG